MDYDTCLNYDAVEEGLCNYSDFSIAQALYIIKHERQLSTSLNEVLDWCLAKYGGTTEQTVIRALTNLLS